MKNLLVFVLTGSICVWLQALALPTGPGTGNTPLQVSKGEQAPKEGGVSELKPQPKGGVLVPKGDPAQGVDTVPEGSRVPEGEGLPGDDGAGGNGGVPGDGGVSPVPGVPGEEEPSEPSDTASSDTDDSPDDVTTPSPDPEGPQCSSLSSKGCEACIATEGCQFIESEEGGFTKCIGLDDSLPSEVADWRIKSNASECDGSGHLPVSTVSPDKSTTTSTESTSTVTTSPISTPNTTTITPSTTETTSAPDTTTPAPTTDTTPGGNSTGSPTTSPSPTTPNTSTAVSTTPSSSPDSGRGHFDGWSFFGGILLTLGLAAIGLVGFKYYRLRSGTGGNYNRF